MIERRGTIYVAPVSTRVPNGRMVDPATSAFFVSWQDWDAQSETGELIEDGGTIVGAEAAVEWGRARSDRVLLRLGQSDLTHFSAGVEPLNDRTDGGGAPLPVWPTASPPAEGWWSREDEAAAYALAVSTPHRRFPGRCESTGPDPADAS